MVIYFRFYEKRSNYFFLLGLIFTLEPSIIEWVLRAYIFVQIALHPFSDYFNQYR